MDYQTRLRLKDDFPYYAWNVLKIRTKEGSVKPFSLNKAQKHIHALLEDQLKKTGRIRAIILKGRQQGCSTYVEGRFFWRVTHAKGVRAFILTHLDEATQNLFEMSQRFYEYCPLIMKPQASTENAKELQFKLLDSGYKVGTAGTKATGRSQTIQFFHGSEVAFWPHADTHAAGVMQAIPDVPGTEVILESTANGMGNYFHGMWQAAESGRSEYLPIFVPWFWQDEYRKPVPDGFAPTPEEYDYAQLYGLDDGQIVWMRSKIMEFKGSVRLFNQEYPATAAIAFQTSGENSFISPELVMKARKATAPNTGAKVGGLDPARFGDDRTAYIVRHGRKAFNLRTWEKKDTMEVAGIAAKLIKEDGLQRLFIDVGGLGAGVVDRLREMGLGDKITAVNGGEKPIDEELYYNKRAEMWGEMHEWLKEQPVQIPDDDALHADLTSIQHKYDSLTRLQMEKKEDMKKRGLRSPDLADALALTFAYPVMEKARAAVKPPTKWVI